MDIGGLTDFDKLTEAQLMCLRLVNQHQTSKQIAIALGISRHTVDQRIARACNILGLAKRGEAARLVAKHDAAKGYDQFIYQLPHIAVAHPNASAFFSSNNVEEAALETEAYVMNDTMVSFDHSKHTSRFSWQFLFPSRWGETNDLTIPKRLAAALAVCATCLMVAAITIASLEGLSRLFSQAP